MKKSLVILASALSVISVSAAFAQTAAPAAAPAMSAASGSMGKARSEQRVEERIAYLHSQLKITPQQESQWNTFADVMRGNGDTMAKLFAARHADQKLSALDDMKQYADIAQAHAGRHEKARRRFRTALREPVCGAEATGRYDVPGTAARRSPSCPCGQEGHSGTGRRSGQTVSAGPRSRSPYSISQVPATPADACPRGRRFLFGCCESGMMRVCCSRWLLAFAARVCCLRLLLALTDQACQPRSRAATPFVLLAFQPHDRPEETSTCLPIRTHSASSRMKPSMSNSPPVKAN